MDKIILHHTLPSAFTLRNDVLSDIWHQDITLKRGEIYLISAASGSGKSSLCSYIYGHRNDYQGIICFDNLNISLLKPTQWTRIRQQNISILWQDLRLFPELTAYENIALKNSLTGFKKRKQIEHWFDQLNIADKLHSKASHMSFGQLQRVALIRALVQPFDFLLADEPISHLDETNAKIVGDLISSEAKQRGATILITSIGKHPDIVYDKTFRL